MNKPSFSTKVVTEVTDLVLPTFNQPSEYFGATYTIQSIRAKRGGGYICVTKPDSAFSLREVIGDIEQIAAEYEENEDLNSVNESTNEL